MPQDFFGPGVAPRYDADSAAMFAPEVLEPALDRLQAWADGGPALEFAIGTGRVGLPLAARGVPVTGLELSEAMVAELRAKRGGADLAVTVGDMASTRVDGGPFRLVYLVFNTIVNLTSQDAQVDCFANAAAHLAPGGRFVVEVNVPRLQQLTPGAPGTVFAASDEHVGVDTWEPAEQRMTSHHFSPEPDGRWRHNSVPFRFVWPSELDLMARLAGLRLVHRWADWHGAPFTAESPAHVSVWERVP